MTSYYDPKKLDCKKLDPADGSIDDSINEYFVYQADLGTGAYGLVYSAKSTDKARREIGQNLPDMVAVKRMEPKNDKYKLMMRDEIRILKHIETPYTMKYYGCYTRGAYVYVITELVPGKDVYDLVVGLLLNDKDRKDITIKLGLGIAALHDHNIVHRDIKPENIMYDKASKRLTILDYGFSCLREPSIGQCEGNVGTPGYMDMKVQGGDFESMKKSDWWSYGQTIHVLYTGRMLYTEQKLFSGRTLGSYKHMDDRLAFPLADLIREIVNPAKPQDKRPTEEYIKERLQAEQTKQLAAAVAAAQITE